MLVNKAFYVISLFLLFTSCNSGKKQSGSPQKPLEENFQNIEINYAKRFSISKRDGITRLSVHNPWQGVKNVSYQYYLIEKGYTPPSDVDPAKIITIPIEKIVCLSTTHIGFIDMIGETEKITGIAGSQYVSNPLLNDRLSKGLVMDLGYDQGLNYEAIVKMKPDVVMVYGVGSETTSYVNRLKDLGIKVIFNAEYLEETPLAKAEWVKFVASLFQKDELALDLFDKIDAEYNSLAQIAHKAKKKPGVLINLPWKGTWYMAGGNSFFVRMIEDAGGKYLWKENKATESFPVDIENVFQRAMNAEVWINTGSANSLRDILAEDSRLKSIRPFTGNRVFNNNNRLNPFGGNDYWEKGITEPHIILKDLIHIFHPDLMPEHELVYYKHLR